MGVRGQKLQCIVKGKFLGQVYSTENYTKGLLRRCVKGNCCREVSKVEIFAKKSLLKVTKFF